MAKWIELTAIIITIIVLGTTIILLLPKEEKFIDCGTNETCFKEVVKKCQPSFFYLELEADPIEEIQPFRLPEGVPRNLTLKEPKQLKANFTIPVAEDCLIVIETNIGTPSRNTFFCNGPFNDIGEDLLLDFLNKEDCST